jgi:hypothetical protein
MGNVTSGVFVILARDCRLLQRELRKRPTRFPFTTCRNWFQYNVHHCAASEAAQSVNQGRTPEFNFECSARVGLECIARAWADPARITYASSLDKLGTGKRS